LSGNPEDLLRGALEKIVYFECRLAQLESELKAARDIALREKDSAATARARESSAIAELAQARNELQSTRHRDEDLVERVRLLEGERERFLEGLIDQARIAGAPRGDAPPSGEADLAGFIAEMRAEIDRLRPWKAAAERAGLAVADPGAPPLPPPGARVEELARRFESSGRIGLGPGEVARLERGLAGRAERTLFETSMEDLASPDPRTRRRAAEALQAMQMRNAAPLVAAAVGREPDGEVKAALLSALAALAEPPAVEIATRELGDPRPVVRTAALEAMASLGGAGAEPRILEAFGDPSPAVRRRAVLLAGFFHNPATDEALAAALADREPSVARAAALSLSGRPTPLAQAALTRALDHSFEPVRRVASETVARWSGEAVAAGAPGEDRRRAARRIAERLGRIEAEALRDAVVTAGPDAPADPVPALEARVATPAARAPLPVPAAGPTVRAASPRDVAAAPAPRARVAVAVVDEAAGELDEVEAAVLLEIRSALRGRAPEEIARLVPGPSDDALRSLVARGAVVRRGARYFPA
jgi:hypothetical protein